MSENLNAIEQAAVLRLFELASKGETDSGEFARLEAMVYERLAEGYAGTGSSCHASGIQTFAAAAA